MQVLENIHHVIDQGVPCCQINQPGQSIRIVFELYDSKYI